LDLSAWVVAPLANLSLLGPVVTAAASEGIRKGTGMVSWLHWPDLITIEGRAVGKTRVSASAGRTAAVIEIVVNCFAPTAEHALSSGLRSTSILDALGVEVDMGLLRERIIDSLDWYSAEWERGVYAKLVARIQPSITWLGRKVKVKTTDGDVLYGAALELNETGSLMLRLRGEKTPAAVGPDLVEWVFPLR